MSDLRDTFIVQFPEFANSSEVLVDAMLAAASLEIDEVVWGAKARQGQFYLAAHKLSLSPFGNNAEMQGTGGMGPHGGTVYGMHYDILVRQVGHGFRVA